MQHLSSFAFRAHPQGIEYSVPVRAGQTLHQMLLEVTAGKPYHGDVVILDPHGHEVPPALWNKVRPKPGARFLVVNHSVHGNAARTVLMIAVMAAAMWVTAGGAAFTTAGGATWFGASSLSAAALGATVMVAGTMLVDKLVPLAQPGTSTGTRGQWNQITGFRNRANQWGAVPCVLGEDLIYPTYAAAPYSEVVGETSYHYYLFELGPGDDLLVDQMTINGTDTSDYDEVYINVTRTPRLYLNTVLENAVGADMDDDGEVVYRTTEPDTDRISIDILKYAGLFGVGTSGKDFSMYVGWSIRYRPVGDDAAPWQLPENPQLSRMTTQRPQKAPLSVTGVDYWVSGMYKNPFGATIAWDVPRGQYEVRVRRVNSHRGSASNTYVDQARWHTLRSIRLQAPTNTSTNKVEMRIRASGRLTGFIDGFRCRVRQQVPVYDRETDTWSAPVFTKNPAWVVYWHMTRNPGLHLHAGDEEMHLEVWANYAEYCATHGLEIGTTADVRGPNREMINKLLGGAMASLGKRDGKWLPVYDPGDVVPRDSFSALDLKDFRLERTHRENPHAVRVLFKNTLAGWREDEVIVLADGYSLNGLDARGNPSALPAPTRWETHRLELAMTPQQVWVLIRYQMAQAEYRPWVASWSTGRAGLRVVRGDAVRVSHDSVQWGTGAGFVAEVTAGGYAGAAATVRLDETIASEPGKTYQLQLRHRRSGETRIVACTPHSAYTDTFYLPALPPGVSLGQLVEPGDTAVLGESEKVSEVVFITGVRYPELLRPALTAVAYDPRIGPYWANPPENLPTALGSRASELPDPPDLVNVISSPEHDMPDDAGIVGPMIRIGVRQRSRPMTQEMLEA